MGIQREYSGEEDLPLGAYAAFVGAFGLGLGALLVRAWRRDALPERVPPGDAVLLGLATHKLTRIVAKDWVTAPLRAPFARYQGPAPGGEVRERSRGRGWRRAVGDLVTCSYCTGPWVAMGLAAGYLEAPRATRVVAGIFSAVAVSDWLHRGYERLGARGERRDRREWKPDPSEEIGEIPTDGGGESEGRLPHLEMHPDDF